MNDEKKTTTLDNDSVRTTCRRSGASAHEMAPAALNWPNARRHGLALPPHAHGGLPWKSHDNSTELLLMATFLPNDLTTASHQRPKGKKKTCDAVVRISRRLVLEPWIQESWGSRGRFVWTWSVVVFFGLFVSEARERPSAAADISKTCDAVVSQSGIRCQNNSSFQQRLWLPCGNQLCLWCTRRHRE